jgi:hypothetical protein
VGCTGFEGLKVRSILGAAGQALVQDHRVAPDKVYAGFFQNHLDVAGPRNVKAYSGE